MFTPTTPPPLAYSIKDACRATSLGRTTIYAHIAAGYVKPHQNTFLVFS